MPGPWSRRSLLAAASVWLGGALADRPVNTGADRLGDALDDRDFVAPGFSADFSTMPEFAKGAVQPSPARTLSDPGFAWRAGYIHAIRSPGVAEYVPRGRPSPAFSWLPAELAVYPNADAIAQGGYSPFSVEHGTLVITAADTPDAMRKLIPEGASHEYISGAISSYPYAQTYGYFELRGLVPAGRGLWPAFWLLPVDMSWPPEIDVMEVLGHDPRTLFTTLHSKRLEHGTMLGFGTKTADLSADEHLYGVDWGPDRVRYYLDRRLVFSEPTPEDWHQPFYLIANLAVGGPTSWPGAPDATTVFPAHFRIAAIRAWQRRSYQRAG